MSQPKYTYFPRKIQEFCIAMEMVINTKQPDKNINVSGSKVEYLPYDIFLDKVGQRIAYGNHTEYEALPFSVLYDWEQTYLKELSDDVMRVYTEDYVRRERARRYSYFE